MELSLLEYDLSLKNEAWVGALLGFNAGTLYGLIVGTLAVAERMGRVIDFWVALNEG